MVEPCSSSSARGRVTQRPVRPPRKAPGKTEGPLAGQGNFKGVSGTCKDLTDHRELQLRPPDDAGCRAREGP